MTEKGKAGKGARAALHIEKARSLSSAGFFSNRSDRSTKGTPYELIRQTTDNRYPTAKRCRR